MSKKFKVGDKVRVRSDDNHRMLTPNQIYEVLDLLDYGDRIRIRDNTGLINAYFFDRFELVEEHKSTPTHPIHWELYFTFKHKEQLRQFTKQLLDQDTDYDIGIQYENNKYLITIEGIWSHNLEVISNLLSKLEINA